MRTFFLLLLAVFLVGCTRPDPTPVVPLEGAPPDSVLEASLERAVTMDSVLHLYPWAIRQWQANLDLVAELQPSLVGRAALVWGWEHLMIRSLNGLTQRVAALHEAAPEAVVQGCIFEYVSRDIERIMVPRHVLEAFDQPTAARAYDFEAMLPVDREPDWFVGQVGQGAVPDITRPETRMWFFHLASLYLDAGLEAIHLGNLERMARSDPNLLLTSGFLRRVRDHAVEHARRGWVILDAHTHGLKIADRLLLDFHSFPLRPQEVGDAAQADVVLELGFQDSIYGRSLGGITPSGRWVAHQLFLVEVDNGYAGATPGGCELPECVWGSDEITWFATRPTADRDRLLRYFWERVPALDPAGRFQCPVVRPLQARLSSGCSRYLAHRSRDLSCGADQAPTIAELWWGSGQD